MNNLNPIEFKEAFEKDQNAILIDVRTPEEIAESSIEGSLNLNIMDPSFTAKAHDLDKRKNLYVFCRSGARSASACQFFNQIGMNAINLNGGILAWNQYFES